MPDLKNALDNRDMDQQALLSQMKQGPQAGGGDLASAFGAQPGQSEMKRGPQSGGGDLASAMKAGGSQSYGAAPAPAAPAAASYNAPAPAAAPAAAAPAAPPAPTSSGAMPPGATDMGNNLVKLGNGQVVPRDHPIYLAAMQAAGGGAAAGGAAAGAAAPGASPASTPAGSDVAGIAASASTVSATPGAAPTQNTANQGAQDVLRNSLLQRATQSTAVDTNDPTFRRAADTNAAAQERARRSATDMAGESMAANGMGSSGAMDAERRMQTEKAAQGSAGFESQLALSELQNKRQEIASALSQLGGTISGDQARALQQRLADMDAAIKNKSIDQSGQLGNADIGLRRDMGTGSLNLQGMGLLLNNQQANNRLGFDIGSTNATLNAQAMRTALGL